MAFTANGLSPAQIQSIIVNALVAHQQALLTLQSIYRWTSGLATADMETAAGLNATDAVTYLSAIADSNAEANLHFTGQPGGSCPAPPESYVYSATQAQVTGPLT